MLSTTENMYSSNWGSLPHFDKNVFFFREGEAMGAPPPLRKITNIPASTLLLKNK